MAAALGIPLDAVRSALISQVAGAIAGGVDVVQIREGDLEAGEYASLVRECGALAASSPTRIVVNDRLDVALAAAAHGVHLRESSIDVASARRIIGRDILIGRSVHDARLSEQTRGADYLIAGSVFATESKRGAAASLGLHGLRDVVNAALDCPVWAVGGITAETVPDVIQCGARGVAAIGAFIPSDRSQRIDRAVENLAQALRFSFDTPPGLS